MFKILTTIEDMHEKIHQHTYTFFYITQPNCSVCHGLQPQIEQILADFPNIFTYQVDASKTPRVAGDFQVFTAPTLLLFMEGKEYLREVRFVQTSRFREKILRVY